MAQYKLHCFCQSGNAYKLALYLNCAGLDWEPVFVDFFKGRRAMPVARERQRHGRGTGAGDGRQDAHPVRRHPAVPGGDDRQVRARDRRRAQRGAALDPVRQPQVHQLLRHLPVPAPARPPGTRRHVLAFLKGRFDAAAAIVDKHLAGSKFMVGDKPTIADFSVAGYVFYPVEEHGYDWAKSHPNIHAWTERVRALPGWKDPYELMPGERFKPVR